VFNWFVRVNENHTFKYICFKFFGKVFEINHCLLVGIYVNPSPIVIVMSPVLLLKCSWVARVMIVTDAVDCDDCKPFIVLAKEDIAPKPAPRQIFS
jgi:hypothetical protein